MAPPQADAAAKTAATAAEPPSLLAGAVDVLPEGRLAEQLAEGRPLRLKLLGQPGLVHGYLPSPAVVIPMTRPPGPR